MHSEKLAKHPDRRPRLLSIFVIDENSVNPSGNYSIRGFANFYVTGWSGSPSRCSGQNDAEPDDATNWAIWGHYVKLALPSADGTASATQCDPLDTTACIPVLVR